MKGAKGGEGAKAVPWAGAGRGGGQVVGGGQGWLRAGGGGLEGGLQCSLPHQLTPNIQS